MVNRTKNVSVWKAESFSYRSAHEGLGNTKRWERAEPGQLTKTDLRDIPYHMTSCEKMMIIFREVGWGQMLLRGGWALVSRCWAIALCITCFVITHIHTIIVVISLFLCCLSKKFVISTYEFYLFFQISPPFYWQAKEWEKVCVFSCLLGWTITMNQLQKERNQQNVKT